MNTSALLSPSVRDDRQQQLAADSRLLLLTELYPPAIGGTPVLFESVYSRAHSSPVTVLTDETSSAGPAGAGRTGPLEVVHAPVRTPHWGLLNARGLLHHLRLARRLRQLAGADRAVVHCGRALPEGVAAWLSRLAAGPPYVVWAHGEDITTACTSRELSFVMKRVYGKAAGVIANSLNTQRLLMALGVPAARIHVIYPGVDAQRFHPGVDGRQVRARYATRDQLLLLSVGRHQRRKGHDHALEAMALLRERLPQLRYVITGDGQERPRLEALVSRYGLGDRVRFSGPVPAAELPAWYAACDLFIHPNRVDDGDVEGFGIVFLEAAASGKPAIGGRSGGVPEAVEDGVTGLLVSGTDVAELAGAIAALADAPRLRQALGAAGRQRVLRDFTWQRAADAVDKLQRSILDP